jgi:hypothetical protein
MDDTSAGHYVSMVRDNSQAQVDFLAFTGLLSKWDDSISGMSM